MGELRQGPSIERDIQSSEMYAASNGIHILEVIVMRAYRADAAPEINTCFLGIL
jgi:hypothetical protein